MAIKSTSNMITIKAFIWEMISLNTVPEKDAQSTFKKYIFSNNDLRARGK